MANSYFNEYTFVYAEACADMREETFVMCHIHAFAYFGGVTRLLTPDYAAEMIIG